MDIKVYMLAFGKPGEIRTVVVPNDEWTADTDKNLGLVFYYGQNDFQPQNHPSVSVNDVIQIGDGYWVVRPIGFMGFTPEQFSEYVATPRLDRDFFNGFLTLSDG